MSEENNLTKAYIALSRRCHVDGWRFLNFATCEMPFIMKKRVMTAVFKNELTGKSYECFIYVDYKENKKNRFLEVPSSFKHSPMNIKDVVTVFSNTSGDIYINNLLTELLNPPLCIWRHERDILESLCIEHDLNLDISRSPAC